MWIVLAVAFVVLGAAVAGAQFAPDVRDALGEREEALRRHQTRGRQHEQGGAHLVHVRRRGGLLHDGARQPQGEAHREGQPRAGLGGQRAGPHFVGKGEILRDPALAEKMAPAYDQKYWISWLGFFRPAPTGSATARP